METVELIIKIALFILNVSTVAFIVIMISKWHKRMEDKLNRYIHHVTDRNDIVYINQLEEIKRTLIESERYEEADKISKCIEIEFDNFKRRVEK